MTLFKRGCALFFLLLFPQICRAELSPVSMTLFGIYGSPVNPPVLANAATDAVGINFLVDWNASPFTSWGLGFENVAFHSSPSFSLSVLNLETRMFPLENEKGKFSPYLFGGAGFNLNSNAGQGALKFKAGIGSRVSMAGPLYFDLAAGSHWVQAPGAFQYVDFRAGLSLSLPEGKETPRPTPTMTATSAPTPSAHTPWALGPTPTETPPPIVIDAAPVTTLAQVKKYYREGMNAFMARNYALSLRLLTKSLASKEIHGAAYYYAETYATIGVIYQFHAKKVKDHDLKALKNYEKALAIDPTTKSAKTYYKKLKAKVEKQKKLKKKPKKKKPRPTPTPAGETTQGGTSVEGSSSAGI